MSQERFEESGCCSVEFEVVSTAKQHAVPKMFNGSHGPWLMATPQLRYFDRYEIRLCFMSYWELFDLIKGEKKSDTDSAEPGLSMIRHPATPRLLRFRNTDLISPHS